MRRHLILLFLSILELDNFFSVELMSQLLKQTVEFDVNKILRRKYLFGFGI